MSIKRDIPATARTAYDEQESEVFPIVFLTIRHPTLMQPIRVVSDPEYFMLGGHEYIGFTFDITILSDTEAPPISRLSIQNVDRIIGRTVLRATDTIRMDMLIINSDQFDLTATPRVPLGDPEYVYRARQLHLTDVDGDTIRLSGTLRTWNYTQETWPAQRATENRTPGLYW